MLIPFSNAGLKPLTSALLADASDVAANFEPFSVREIAPWHQQGDRLHIQLIERVIGIPVSGIVPTGGVWKERHAPRRRRPEPHSPVGSAVSRCGLSELK
jgi:hypothetical protein